MIDISIPELIEMILLLISLGIIFVGCIMLFLDNKIPKSKLLLVAYIGSVVGVSFTLLETSNFIGDSYLFNSIVSICLGIMYVMGAYGFWCLVKYSTRLSANK